MAGRSVDPSREKVLVRRERVGALYLQGMSQSAIALEVGVNQGTVSRDLAALRELWTVRSVESINEKKAIELAKIDALELTYWDAWNNSLKPKEITSQERLGTVYASGSGIVGTKVRETKRFEVRDGNPGFLSGVMSCIDKRCKILGLDAANRNLNVDLNSLTDDQLERLAAGADVIEVLALGSGDDGK